MFWEAINAAGVMQIPLAVFVWDDGYGISVPVKYQTTKGSISAALKRISKTRQYQWHQYLPCERLGLCQPCAKCLKMALQHVRETHVPAVFHIEEMTQPQGHSTSGSHERYKSAERLEWERTWDDIRKFKEWIIENGIADEAELETIRTAARKQVKEARDNAWKNYLAPLKEEASESS